MEGNHILLVDGMALLFRGFYATSFRKNFMVNRDGIPTNGIFQYMRYFFNAIERFQPTHVICCWDMGKETFRNELYHAYKANRKEPPKELIPQFDLVKAVMDIYNIPNIGLKNYEADDCIGTLAEIYKQNNCVTILSGDQDFRQLVDKNVQLALMLRGQGNYRLYTKENFYKRLKITPQQVIDIKALMGDQADNYPGIKGIGEKTAFKLIQKYHSIEQFLNHLHELSESMRSRIEDNLEMIHLSKELATIKRNVPLHLPLEKAIFQYNEQVVYEQLNRLDLAHIIV